MLRSLLSNFELSQAIILFLLMLPVTLLSLSVHEMSHGYAAYKMGDNTAKMMGRLSLDPMKHLDPIGFLCMIFFGFGWAKPVPVNPRNFDNYKKGIRLVSIAGPLSNFVLMFTAILLYRIFVQIFMPDFSSFSLIEAGNAWLMLVARPESLAQFTSLTNALISIFFYFFAIGNAGLCIFNLIPIPPLDGSKLFLTLLPQKAQIFFVKNERILSMILLFAVAFGLLGGPLSTFITLIVSLVDKLFLLIPNFPLNSINLLF
jgi:Zn-dependent protease